MADPTVIHILIHSFTLILLTVCFWLVKRAYDTSPRKVIYELLDALSALEARHDRLDGKYKKLNANYALLLAREKSNGKVDDDPTDEAETAMRPGESPAEWKHRMRIQMASGGLKHK